MTIVQVMQCNYWRLFCVYSIEGSDSGHGAAAAAAAAASADYILITPHVWVCCFVLTAIFKSFTGILLKGPMKLSKVK